MVFFYSYINYKHTYLINVLSDNNVFICVFISIINLFYLAVVKHLSYIIVLWNFEKKNIKYVLNILNKNCNLTIYNFNV